MEYRTFVSDRAKEIWLQLGVFVLLLLIKAFAKESDPHLHFFEILPTTLQLGVALGINYWLLTRFFYPKKYLAFLFGSLWLLICGVLLKDIILEGLFIRSIPMHWGAEFFDGLRHFFPTVLLFVGLKLAWDARQQQTEVERLKAAVTESELQFLKSQINPHFLFNNLNNLYAHSLNKSPKTPDIILELSSLMRYMLHECKEKFVALEKEFKYLRDFINLQGLQIENKAQVELKIQGETADKFIAPLILVTFVENCFKHSMSSQTEQIKIIIELDVEDHLLQLYCANTYSTNSNLDQLSKGIGLENVRSRLELLYPNAHLLHVHCEHELYEVRLEMDLSHVKS